MRAGHPCYFIGFTPVPEPGQTIEAVIDAWGVFLERVAELHAGAEGKPVVIGNCQAGWALMMLAAKRPELCGPIIVAGSPLSYWAGCAASTPCAIPAACWGAAG
jgi:pimeloyl-ACP methyl ester carboxylesterase